ncbi:hypothetical protein OLX23_16920 [Novosphingobium sp. JCM 18896]|nr:hypothetical protein [Novosphingobium sp. JCM 18896]
MLNAPHANAPLVVSFAFVSWESLPAFDFVGRVQKMSAATQRPINCLYLRDSANLWYQHGIAGLGRNVHETAARIRQLIEAVRPTSVTMVGQSMGAYAAVLYGALLGVDRVLAFGPLSYLRSDWARRDDDLRWIAVMEALERHPPSPLYDDLPALLSGLDALPEMQLVYGTGAETDGSTNLDRLHAERFAQVEGVRIMDFPQAPHAVVKWLIDEGRMDALLQTCLLAEPGTPRRALAAPPPSAGTSHHPSFNDEWRTWIAENLLHGVDPADLLLDLAAQDFHLAEAQREIDKALRSPYLAPALRPKAPAAS